MSRFDSSSIEQAIERSPKQKGLPPVNDWQPALSGDIDILINRQGEWFHEGDAFQRMALVKLFASILRKDDDDYYLLTPVEKWRIQVADAPFIITQMEVEGAGTTQQLFMQTNIGDRFCVDQQHPLWFVNDTITGEPSPYVRVRDRLDALLSRPVFYQLVELLEERVVNGREEQGVYSSGQFFVLSED